MAHASHNDERHETPSGAFKLHHELFPLGGERGELVAQLFGPAACPASARRGATELLSVRRTGLQARPAAATSFRDSRGAPSTFDYA